MFTHGLATVSILVIFTCPGTVAWLEMKVAILVELLSIRWLYLLTLDPLYNCAVRVSQ